MVQAISKEQIILEACELWDAGQAWETGELVDLHIPMERRAEWIAKIIEVLYERFDQDASIDAVLDFARNPNKFGNENRIKAHRVVGNVNHYASPEMFSQTIFILAAHAGKVVYNAQGFGAPFDYHAALTVFVMAKQIAQEFKDDAFSANVWAALCPKSLIVVDKQPIYPDYWSYQRPDK